MYSKIISAVLQGTDGAEITVETDVSFGFPSFSIVGLPDAAIRESKERVRIAASNSGFGFPDRKVTVNLSPAGVKKEGTHLDLPIAIGIFVSSGEINSLSAGKYAFLGELALDGSLNGVRGILPMIMELCSKGVHRIIIPSENLKEGAMVKDAEVYGAGTLNEVLDFLKNKANLQKAETETCNIAKWREYGKYENDFEDVIGHEEIKRAMQIAAAAMHNLLMTGPPGSGKTMLAKCMPSILPPLTYEEQLEVAKIYSVSGCIDSRKHFAPVRPFRAPDHTISPTALIGGGSRIRAGEVSLAHLGVLFLDEFPEFSRAALEALRKPLEDEEATVSRLSGTITFPSKFILIAAMNPCPCGYFGTDAGQCTCSAGAIARYRNKLSGPLMDRIDISTDVKRPELSEIRNLKKGTSSAELRRGVEAARKMQEERYKNEEINYNSQMRPKHIAKYCKPDKEGENILNEAFEKMGLSVRSYNRILKVARTIADIDQSREIKYYHVAEAVHYKCDRKIFR